MKKFAALLLCMALSASALTGCSSKPKESEVAEPAGTKTESTKTEAEMDESEENSETTEENTDEMTGLHHVEIEVKDYGTIAVELDADTAPITVTNFIKLAEDGFYDGLTFHRIISGFMIQGGDPLGNGTGGSDETIKGEFAENGIENDISHVRGVISMARSQMPDSASSQFFIVHEDSTYLDGQYAAFGRVTEGMNVVDEICKDIPVQDANGTVASKDQPVITTIKVID